MDVGVLLPMGDAAQEGVPVAYSTVVDMARRA
jgi:hypothetical protein